MARAPIRAFRRRTQDFESLWLITFADLMVQLMAFFVVIYSFSVKDQQKLGSVLKSFQKTLGLKGENSSIENLPSNLPIQPAGSKPADLEALLSDLKAQEGPAVGKRMRLVTFRGSILFPEGSSQIDPSFQPLLDRIAQMAIDYPGFELICVGYAAPDERGPRNADALELSGQRAQAIVRALVQQGVNAMLLSAEAKGDSFVEGNPSTPEGRALQRRVKFRYQRISED